ncbi:hypothetical protein BHE74_00024800 [Ensete ventricosum]|nr:hypothetical protein GW17_00000017 [Ensete ventricosum]RWW67731.1 hypothetical protein BHE74_00024800 [Ensete ventricosum]
MFSGVSETLVLNMATLVWSVVTTVQGRVPLASEVHKLCLVSHFYILFVLYASRDMEPEIEPAQYKKIKEIVLENDDSEPLNIRNEVTVRLVEALKAEKGELEGTLNKEQLQTLRLKQEFNEAESRNIELTKASFIFVLLLCKSKDLF